MYICTLPCISAHYHVYLHITMYICTLPCISPQYYAYLYITMYICTLPCISTKPQCHSLHHRNELNELAIQHEDKSKISDCIKLTLKQVKGQRIGDIRFTWFIVVVLEGSYNVLCIFIYIQIYNFISGT